MVLAPNARYLIFSIFLDIIDFTGSVTILFGDVIKVVYFSFQNVGKITHSKTFNKNIFSAAFAQNFINGILNTFTQYSNICIV